MLDHFYKILGIILCFSVSKCCFSEHWKGADQTAIANYQKMLADTSTILAELAPQYKEVTMKVMGARIKNYEFEYHFALNGVTYNGTHSFGELPTVPRFAIYYLKTNPKIHCADPASKLKIELNKTTSKSNLYTGIGLALLGFASVYSFIEDLRRKKQVDVS
jgi:hypothetical protein